MDANLSHLYNAALQDPLFAAEGMDLEQGIAALERIQGQCEEAEALVGRGSWKRKLFLARYPIAKYALPVTFLRAFIESERARRAFVYSPSPRTARALLSQWKRTAHAYAHDLERYAFLHKAVFALEGKTDAFRFEDLAMNETTLEDVRAMLAAFKQNAQMLAEDVERREALFRQGAPYRTVRQVPELPTYKPTTISAKHQHVIDLELESGFPFRSHELVQTFGPFSYTLRHFDSAPTEHAFYAFIMQDKDSQSRFLKISLADQFYFLDLSEFDWRTRGIHAPVIEQGISHWIQSATHGYVTRDQLYVADMATMIDLELRPWLNRANVSLQRSSMLDLMLMGASFDFDMYLGNTRARMHGGVLKIYPSSDSVLMRTHPSVFYLPFNRSVWRLETLPNFLGTRRSGAPKYKTLDAIEPTLAPGMLERIMQGPKIRDEARKQASVSL